MTIIENNTQNLNSLENIKIKNQKLRNKKTDRKLIKILDKGYDKTGKHLLFDYVSWGTVARWLDEYYPCWSMEILPDSIKNEAGSINCIVKLTVFEEGGIPRIIQCCGTRKIDIKQSDGSVVSLDYWKSAETDAFKRCVARLGGFNDIYTDNTDELTEDTIEYIFDQVFPRLTKIAESEKYPDYTMDNVAKTLKGYFKGVVTLEQINHKFMRTDNENTKD